jgi:hypothetical protein
VAACPVRPPEDRRWYVCRSCGRRVIDWGRVGHWQGHHAARLPWFDPVPREELAALFTPEDGQG